MTRGRAGNRRGGHYRQVALDKSGLAHTAISDKEKLELGDLSLCHGNNTEHVPQRPKSNRKQEGSRAGPKQRTTRSKQQEAHVRTKPPPQSLHSFVHKATTTPQSPRLFLFRPSLTQLLSTPKMSPPRASGHTTMASVVELLPSSNISVNGRCLLFRWRPCNPQLVMATPASRFPEKSQPNPAQSIGANGGRMLANRGPAIVLYVYFFDRRLLQTRPAARKPAWNPKREQTVPCSSREIPSPLAPTGCEFQGWKARNGQFDIPDLRIMHALQPRELPMTTCWACSWDASALPTYIACVLPLQGTARCAATSGPPQRALLSCCTGPLGPRSPDEGLLDRPANRPRGRRSTQTSQTSTATPGHTGRGGVRVLTASSLQRRTLTLHSSFSACLRQLRAPHGRPHERPRDTCGPQTARLCALHAAPTRPRPVPKLGPQCTTCLPLARAPRRPAPAARTVLTIL